MILIIHHLLFVLFNLLFCAYRLDLTEGGAIAIHRELEEDNDWDTEGKKCQKANNTCMECLSTYTKFGYDCGFVNGECELGGFDGGFFAHLSFDDEIEADDLQTKVQERCNSYEAHQTNEADCIVIQSCQDCIAKELPAGDDDGFCLWFKDHDSIQHPAGGWCTNRIPHTSEKPVRKCSRRYSSVATTARAHCSCLYWLQFILLVSLTSLVILW